MNSLVFNKTADELRASVYGYNQDTDTLQLLQLNSLGELLVAGDFNITNTTLTVSGEVNVTNSTLSVVGELSVTNTLLTVSGSINAVVEGRQFFDDFEEFEPATAPGVALANTDISQMQTATFFINNTGSTTITVTLQLSPDGTTYFDDPNYKDIVLAGTTNTIMVAGVFAHYVQVQYDPGASATFTVHFNGQA